MSKLLMDVCEQLGTVNCIKLIDQQQTKFHRLRHPPIASQVPVSPSLISRGFPTTHLKPAHEEPSPFEVNCTPSPSSFQWLLTHLSSSLRMKLRYDQQLLKKKKSFCVHGWRLIINLWPQNQSFTNGIRQLRSPSYLRLLDQLWISEHWAK